jgi:hypothetical protein
MPKRARDFRDFDHPVQGTTYRSRPITTVPVASTEPATPPPPREPSDLATQLDAAFRDGIEQGWREALANRDGICGDESPSLRHRCGPPPVCTLRFGHRSEWHENDTGTRWRHARVDRDRMVAAAALREYADRHHHFGQAGSGPIDVFDVEHWAECSCGAEWSTETEHGFEGCTERDQLLADAAALEVGEPAADADGKSSGERAGAERSDLYPQPCPVGE